MHTTLWSFVCKYYMHGTGLNMTMIYARVNKIVHELCSRVSARTQRAQQFVRNLQRKVIYMTVFKYI